MLLNGLIIKLFLLAVTLIFSKGDDQFVCTDPPASPSGKNELVT